MAATHNLHVIVGLGATGLSCVRYLVQQGIPVAVIDSRQNPPGLQAFKQRYPDVPLVVGNLDHALLDQAAKLIVSPGVSLKETSIQRQLARGIPVIGDIELFAERVKAPVIAITGTNAKSTVTTLVGKMAEASGLRVAVGGNLGIPALDLLLIPDIELFVLELSSFQLETTFSLKSRVATVLNISPDHMDRYVDLKEYCAAKHRVYLQAEIAVSNKDDALTSCNTPVTQQIYFTLNEPAEHEFGLRKESEEVYLAEGSKLLISARKLPILGRHYQANALAALAIGNSFGLPMQSMLETLIQFKGLPHRCQLVRERKKIAWYNDSKGTNVGATLAAIEGLGPEIKGKLILIAGGVGKNADFSPLVPSIEKYVKTVILIGEAAAILAELMGDRVDVQFATSMEQAVSIAERVAHSHDSVLLSPACASFDMFNNFEHRGDVFSKIVKGL